jgi:small subunit ribosomal protein S17
MEKEQEILNEETSLVQDSETLVNEVAEEVTEVNEVAEEITNVIEIAEVKTHVVAEEIVKDLAPVKINKRVLQGKVVSNKADKTIIIKVERQVSHPIYKKYYKKTNKFMAHDENNDCNQGDDVRVRECRPLSKRKSWELVEIVNRAK